MNVAVGSTIRPFATADVSAVATLFFRVFLHRKGPGTRELEDYLTSIFLTAPWIDPEISSLVHVRPDGKITGFIGVSPLPLQWGDRRLRGAVCGTLMVDDHESDPMAGARLLRAFLAGPQDVSFSETAADVSVAMWQRLKGIIMPQHSMTYLRVLRPFRYIADGLRQQTPFASFLTWIADPVDALLRKILPSSALRRWSYVPTRADRCVEEDLALETLADVLPRLISDYQIRPDWSEQSLARILADAAIKKKLGPMTARLVRSPGGTPVGAYLYHGRPGTVGHVMQILATPGNAGAVIDRMLSHAADAGIVALRGRTDPQLLPAMLARDAIFFQNAASTIHSRDPAIIAAFLRGEGFFNGVGGETWSRLIGDNF